MYSVIGHDKVREELRDWDRPFCVVGPPSVGKTGIVYEKQGNGLTSEYLMPGVRNFFVGKLTDQNVSDILRRDFPKVLSRSLAVSILHGSFIRIMEIEALIKGFEQVTQLLTTHSVPDIVTHYTEEATIQACLYRLTGYGWAWNRELIRSSIPEFLAEWYLGAEPTVASTIQFYYGVRDGFVD